MDANGRQFESFVKRGLPTKECNDFCTREPKCGGHYRTTYYDDAFCYVLGPGLAQPAGWDMYSSGDGGVWPIANVGTTGAQAGATCYRKIATTTGNVR